MNAKTELIIRYTQNLAACTALAAGAALIGHYANKLWFGPWLPSCVSIFLAATVGALACAANIDLAVSLFVGGNRLWMRAIATGLMGALLQLICAYFISAGVLAAVSAAP